MFFSKRARNTVNSSSRRSGDNLFLSLLVLLIIRLGSRQSFDLRLWRLRSENLSKGSLQNFIASGSDTGNCRRDLDVGQNADALGWFPIGVEHTDTTDHRP